MKGRNSIRQVSLLPHEEVVQLFGSSAGLTQQVSEKGQLLALTNQRVIFFTQDEGRNQTSIASLNDVVGIIIKAENRSIKALCQGLALILIGAVIYLVLGYSRSEEIVPAVLGAAVAFLGILFIGRHLGSYMAGHVSFQVGGWDMCFPYKTSKARDEVYQLAALFSQLKLGLAVDGTNLTNGPLPVDYHLSDDVEAYSQASGEIIPETEKDPHLDQDRSPTLESEESSHRHLS